MRVSIGEAFVRRFREEEFPPIFSESRENFAFQRELLGHFLAQMNDGRVKALAVRYYGDLAVGRNDMIVNSVLVGLFKPMLEAGITPVNARTIANERGINFSRFLSLNGCRIALTRGSIR